jgi:hypothetical protein
VILPRIVPSESMSSAVASVTPCGTLRATGVAVADAQRTGRRFSPAPTFPMITPDS